MSVFRDGKLVAKPREVVILGDEAKNNIYYFLMGCVYGITNNSDEPFCCSDFVGNNNYYWEETPLIALYDAYCNKYKDMYPGKSEESISNMAVKEAGKESGRLLLKVLVNECQKI